MSAPKKSLPTTVQEDRCEEIEKLRYSKMRDQKHNGSQHRARPR